MLFRSQLGEGGPQAGTLNPHLNPSDARALIAFLETRFGAKVLELHEHGGKVMNAVVMLGDSMVEMGESQRLPMSLVLRMQGVGQVCEIVIDPAGNEWRFDA